jgi:aspartyl/asparaginyl beta-hydroxylase (cupin superfamily)
MSTSVEKLVETAGQLANAGRWDEAERVWLEIRMREPQHPKALFSLGVHALQRGDTLNALELLRAARTAAPTDRLVLMTLCAACHHRGDAEGEREAIEAALALDPYFLPALLAKARWLEHYDNPLAAATTYANCLKIAPPELHWPTPLRPQLEHAKQVVERHVTALGAYLETRLAELQAALPPSLRARWREAAAIRAGKSKPYNADCNQLHVPRLPAIPFFDRAQFGWVEELEAKTDAIRAELLTALETVRDRFSPYIAYGPGEPVNQWQELNHSDRWSTLSLWRGGNPVHENLERCPETARALSRVPMAEIGGLCPNAMFSALAPHTRIPPHHGETNARLVVHLPLIVPPGCWYRVGFDERIWKVGEVLIFDDTIEHEARNDGDELRVVLIFDVWNPLLEPAELALVQTMAVATREYAPGRSPAGSG